ncbi:hypothetical protein C8F01DRAFT_1232503 [Mycena amicta]|nr:hypothetical protein C8F01DRAFT_1232503 [Mycena amicta]
MRVRSSASSARGTSPPSSSDYSLSQSARRALLLDLQKSRWHSQHISGTASQLGFHTNNWLTYSSAAPHPSILDNPPSSTSTAMSTVTSTSTISSECKENRSEIPGHLAQGGLYRDHWKLFKARWERYARLSTPLLSRLPPVKPAFVAVRPPGHHCGQESRYAVWVLFRQRYAVAAAHGRYFPPDSENLVSTFLATSRIVNFLAQRGVACTMLEQVVIVGPSVVSARNIHWRSEDEVVPRDGVVLQKKCQLIERKSYIPRKQTSYQSILSNTNKEVAPPIPCAQRVDGMQCASAWTMADWVILSSFWATATNGGKGGSCGGSCGRESVGVERREVAGGGNTPRTSSLRPMLSSGVANARYAANPKPNPVRVPATETDADGSGCGCGCKEDSRYRRQSELLQFGFRVGVEMGMMLGSRVAVRDGPWAWS